MKNNQIGFKTSILSISILLTIAGSIPGLKQEFNTVSATQIESLVTIPSVTVLIFVLLSTKITQWFTERQVVATGMITIFVAGVISYLAPSFWILYLARLLLGMGVGLFNAFAYSMISEYFDGDERQRLLGYERAITSLGNIVMFIITAGLVLIGWRAVNLYYLITVPILVIFLWGTRKMPNSLQEQSTSESTTGQEIQRNPFSPKLIVLFLLVMFSMFVSTTVVVKIADLVVGSGYGNEFQATIGLAILGFATMVGGALYGKLHKVLARFILPIGLIGATLAIMGMTISHQMIFTYLMAAFAGLTTSLVGPYLFAQSASIAGLGHETFSSAVLIVGINVGVILTPYALNLVQNMVGNHQPQAVLSIVGILMGVVGLLTLFIKENPSS